MYAYIRMIRSGCKSDSRRKISSGLGLSTVKQIVQRLGGGAEFAGALGGGIIFFVELPRLQGIDAGDARDADGRIPREGDTGVAGYSASPLVAPLAPAITKADHA